MSYKEPPEWFNRAVKAASEKFDPDFVKDLGTSYLQGYKPVGRLRAYYEAWLKGQAISFVDRDSALNRGTVDVFRTHTPHPDNPYPPGTLGHELFESDEARKREEARENGHKAPEHKTALAEYLEKKNPPKTSKGYGLAKSPIFSTAPLKEGEITRIYRAIHLSGLQGWKEAEYHSTYDDVKVIFPNGEWSYIPCKIGDKPRKQLKLTPEQLAAYDNED